MAPGAIHADLLGALVESAGLFDGQVHGMGALVWTAEDELMRYRRDMQFKLILPSMARVLGQPARTSAGRRSLKSPNPSR